MLSKLQYCRYHNHNIIIIIISTKACIIIIHTVTSRCDNIIIVMQAINVCNYFAIIRQFLAISSFIHSGHFYSASSSPLLLRHSTDAASEIHAEAPQATAS